MKRPALAGVISVALALAALPALGQDHPHTPGMQHVPGRDGGPARTADLPREGGQAEFAAVGEIANMLQADPTTDWSKVDIDALRRHLLDMDNVMMRARVATSPLPGGARFDVAGDTPDVRQSIQRMVTSHTRMVDGENGRHEVATLTPDGATMIVTAQGAGGEAQIRALGFFGLLTGGAHHQLHHLMMARGDMRHGS